MTNAEMIDDEMDGEVEGEVDVGELRLRLHPLDALRDKVSLTGAELQSQLTFWYDNYDQMWEKHNTEFIFDHLVRDMMKMGVAYQPVFVQDTTDFFTIIVKDSGEQGGATLNKVWKERRDDPMVSVVHHAREQAYGWLNQRYRLPGRQSLATLVHNYFTVQHTFIKQLHWTVLNLNAIKQHWPDDHRVTRINNLLVELSAIDFSVRNKARAHQLGDVTRELQSL